MLFVIYCIPALQLFAQFEKIEMYRDSIRIESHVEFYTYDGPYGQEDRHVEPAIRCVLTVKNLGSIPIPDLDVSNRSQYVNFYVNDSLSNPLSMYNGLEVIGEHIIGKNESDTYTWWFFEKDAYAQVFTVQWQYLGLYSKKVLIKVADRTAVQLK